MYERDADMSYNRMIKFDFCRLYYIKKDDKKKKRNFFDVELMIQAIVDKDLVRKEINIYDGCKVRIENLDYDSQNFVWKLRLLRLRDVNISFIVRPDEEAKPVELGDDEYLGEDMTMLFDVKNNIAMIQRNRFALGFSNLQKVFGKILEDQFKIRIELISKILNIKEIKKDYFKSVELRFANVKEGQLDSIGGSLGDIIKAYKYLGGYGGSFVVNLGRSRKESLAKEPVEKLLDEISENSEVLKAAILRAKNAEDNDIEIFNLFDNIYSVFIEYELAERTALEYGYCTRKMIEKYNEHREYIIQLL